MNIGYSNKTQHILWKKGKPELLFIIYYVQMHTNLFIYTCIYTGVNKIIQTQALVSVK
jgi:hypothetical protein